MADKIQAPAAVSKTEKHKESDVFPPAETDDGWGKERLAISSDVIAPEVTGKKISETDGEKVIKETSAPASEKIDKEFERLAGVSANSLREGNFRAFEASVKDAYAQMGTGGRTSETYLDSLREQASPMGLIVRGGDDNLAIARSGAIDALDFKVTRTIDIDSGATSTDVMSQPYDYDSKKDTPANAADVFDDITKPKVNDSGFTGELASDIAADIRKELSGNFSLAPMDSSRLNSSFQLAYNHGVEVDGQRFFGNEAVSRLANEASKKLETEGLQLTVYPHADRPDGNGFISGRSWGFKTTRDGNDALMSQFYISEKVPLDVREKFDLTARMQIIENLSEEKDYPRLADMAVGTVKEFPEALDYRRFLAITSDQHLHLDPRFKAELDKATPTRRDRYDDFSPQARLEEREDPASDKMFDLQSDLNDLSKRDAALASLDGMIKEREKPGQSPGEKNVAAELREIILRDMSIRKENQVIQQMTSYDSMVKYPRLVQSATFLSYAFDSGAKDNPSWMEKYLELGGKPNDLR